MYLRKYWDVLIVDDEPDVLAISKLALKAVKVYGVPLRLHEFSGKAAAMDYFRNQSEVPDLALAIIDVVMESDQAGLELCDFIRNQLDNRVTTLVVRTGHPGVAERDVTRHFDINEYISKVDANEDKLHDIAHTAVRQFLYARSCEGMLNWVTRFTEAKTREALRKDLADRMATMQRAKSGEDLHALSAEAAFFVQGETIGAGKYANPAAAKGMRQEILGTPTHLLTEEMTGASGERYLRVGDNVLVTTGPGKKVPVELVAQVSFTPMPSFYVKSFWAMMSGLSNCWEHAS